MRLFGRDPRDDIEAELAGQDKTHGAFTSDLSGQEFWLVVDKGYLPVGLVLGNAVFSMGALRSFLTGVRSAFRGELKEYSQLMYDARELALKRMKDEADRLGADGIVGVDVRINETHGGEVMEVTAIGTAIRHVGRSDAGGSSAQVVVPAG